jgi:hypothetical protein
MSPYPSPLTSPIAVMTPGRSFFAAAVLGPLDVPGR